ncbi:unnamed protein product [Kuraishia capsulata CBS 1993]|uniref:Uncharacterized protein n=1 Tax=Kuraishia capsulata CBS 1993 TaxID=1382522 RepID=W6MNE0_9ASCO|nr:uncharacterized protein KUCA_T00004161001 [Kuraishia capsulata CBS 1993]CDK28179.1 unnamed protein product [Kuraishia capsulata CBS 1993]
MSLVFYMCVRSLSNSDLPSINSVHRSWIAYAVGGPGDYVGGTQFNIQVLLALCQLPIFSPDLVCMQGSEVLQSKRPIETPKSSDNFQKMQSLQDITFYIHFQDGQLHTSSRMGSPRGEQDVQIRSNASMRCQLKPAIVFHSARIYAFTAIGGGVGTIKSLSNILPKENTTCQKEYTSHELKPL